MTDYAAIRQALNKTYNLLDTVEGMGGKPVDINAPLRDIFKMELHSFLMYLSATDGKVSFQESKFMNYLFDMQLSSQQYVDFINENNIFSTDFEQKVPITFSLLQSFDKKIALISKKTEDNVEPLMPIILRAYAEIGKAFIECDGAIDCEVNEAKNYLNRIIENLMDNLKADFVSMQNGDAIIGAKKGANNIQGKLSALRNNQYGPSVYKVGVDIPAGEYKVFPNNGKGYFAICADANCDEIIRNENFNGQMYIKIINGQFLKLVRCYAEPISEAKKYCATNGTYYEGEYKVDIEIPAGEYRVVADMGRKGYYSIETTMHNGDRAIISNDNFSNVTYVAIKKGQILKLVRCSIQL